MPFEFHLFLLELRWLFQKQFNETIVMYFNKITTLLMVKTFLKYQLCLVFCILFVNLVIGQEVCNNGIDDDGDGLIDLNDDECDCSDVIPYASINGDVCRPQLTLEVDVMGATAYQWFYNGVALSGEVTNSLDLGPFDFLGNYSCLIDSPSGCSVTEDFELVEELRITDFNIQCTSGSNISNVEITIEGGYSDFTVRWMAPNGDSDMFTTDQTTFNFDVSNVVEGDLQVIIEDDMGCIIEPLLFLSNDCLPDCATVLLPQITRPEFPNDDPNGPYCPGETVQFCYEIGFRVSPRDSGNNCLWIQGIVPVVGGGWDLSVSSISDGTPTGWSYFPEGSVDYNLNHPTLNALTDLNGKIILENGNGGLSPGDLLPEGWWFVTQGLDAGCVLDGDPDNGWGMEAPCDTEFNVDFCFSLTTNTENNVSGCEDGFDRNLDIQLFVFGDGETGCYDSVACKVNSQKFEGRLNCTSFQSLEIFDANHNCGMTSEIIINLTGGNPNYNVTLIPPSGIQQDFNFNQREIILPVSETGDHQVIIEDNLGCTQEVTVNVEDCCTVDCVASSIIVDCLGDVPAIPEIFLDALTNGSEDIDRLLSDNIIGLVQGCTDATVSAEDIPMSAISCSAGSSIIERNYTMDFGGVTQSCIQNIEVIYHTPPSFTIEAQDLNLSCTDDIDSDFQAWLMSRANSELELCNPIISWSTNPTVPEITFSCEGTGSVVVEFMYTDDCGFSGSSTAEFSVTDQEAPEITCPDELVLDCGEDSAQIDLWLSSFTAVDNCSIASTSDDFATTAFQASCGSNGEYLVTFEAVDECGMTEACMRKIIVLDPESFMIDCPDALEVDIQDPDFLNQINSWLSLAVTDDPCSFVDLPVDNDFDSASIDVDCDALNLQVNFMAENACGVERSCTSVITGNVDNRPDLTCPADIEINCDETQISDLVDDWLESVVAVDFNGMPLVVSNDFSVIADACMMSTITFSILDDCGNALSCSSNLTIIDDSAPALNCPSTSAIELSQATPSEQIEIIIDGLDVQDNCTENLTTIFEIDGDLLGMLCGETRTMEVISIDECGNESSCLIDLQFSAISDLTITCAEPLNLDCNENNILDIIDSHVNQNTVTTSSLNFQLDFDYDPSVVNNDCDEVISFDIRVTATDECGNQETCEIPIEITAEAKVFIANIFSPDNDGLNNHFTIYSNSAISMVKDFSIYDRWGERVFHKTNFLPNDESLGWDGTIDGKKAKTSIYTYTTIIETLQGIEEKRFGTVTIVY